MKIYAVIDTNVIVSAVLTHNQDSPTKYILEQVRCGHIIPMTNYAIMEEYIDVLSRSKFNLSQDIIMDIRNMFDIRGVEFLPEVQETFFIDPDDLIFYETYALKEDAYLITGNLRHYPAEPRILSPGDMLDVIMLAETSNGNILSEPLCEYMSEEKQAHLQRIWETLERCGREAEANGTANLTMEEIDEEIRLYRKGKK